MTDTAAEFDLTAKRMVWIEVKFMGMRSVGDQVAEPVEHKVRLHVELVDIPEFQRLFSAPVDRDGNPNPNAEPPATPERIKEWTEMRDVDRAQALVTDWRGVKAGGQTVPFSAENLAKLMRVPNFSQAFFRSAYPMAYSALKETRQGNSEGSPAAGAESGEPA